jgi:hypothetical protein
MSTLTKVKKTTRKPIAKKPVARNKRPIPSWIGSAEGKVFVREGVDLTKPTLPPGKYL